MSARKDKAKGKKVATAPEPQLIGRPTLYKAEFPDQVYSLTLLGATDRQIADALDVSVETINIWKRDIPEFLQAIRSGKTAADARIARSLFERAEGFEFVDEESHRLKNADGSERVEVVKVTRRVPPDTRAAQYWLNNRRRGDWRDVQHLAGDAANPLQVFAGIKIVISNGADLPPQVEHAPQPKPPASTIEKLSYANGHGPAPSFTFPVSPARGGK